jgi:hypothetical protein
MFFFPLFTPNPIHLCILASSNYAVHKPISSASGYKLLE